jgi:hypothetical protein
MRYTQFLYSRSLSKDYRWILIPPSISYEKLKLCLKMFEWFDIHRTHKVLRESKIPTLYCLNFSGVMTLFTCGLSSYRDKYGREISFLQGIAVEATYQRHFWFLLPWLMTQYLSIIDTWNYISFKNADQFDGLTSNTLEWKPSLPDLTLSSEYKYSATSSSNEREKGIIKLDFSATGFRKLLSYVSSTAIPTPEFAFGATNDILIHFPTIKVIGLI